MNDPSLFRLNSKRKKLKLIWNTIVYKERKSKEQQGKKEVAEKELTSVYAYNDGDNHRNRVQGMRVVGCGMACDKGCGMTMIRGTE